MEIILAEEHAYYFIPQISLDIAHDRREKKKDISCRWDVRDVDLPAKFCRYPNGLGREPSRTLLDGDSGKSYSV